MIAEIAGIFGLGVLAAATFRLLRIPEIVGFIIAGFLARKLFGFLDLGIFSEIGLVVLLFMIGLEMNPASIQKAGMKSFIFFFAFTALSTLAFLPFFPLRESLVLTFASTAVVLHHLQANRKMNSIAGRVASSALILQDILAVLLLSGLTSISSIAVGFAVLSLSGVILKRIVDRVFLLFKHEKEMLLLMSVALAMGLAGLSAYLGLSPATGAFLAGLVLHPSIFMPSVEEGIRSLKAFFMSIFFISVGMMAELSQPLEAVILLVGTTVVKAAAAYIASALSGLGKKDRLKLSLYMSGLSEFSLILLSNPAVILSTAASMAGSGAMLEFADLSFFRRKKPKTMLKDHIILFGCHRTGHKVAEALKGKDLLIVEHDPERVEKLKRNGFRVLFGSITDPETHEKAGTERARMIISTVPVLKYNLLVCREFKKPRKIMVAKTPHEALKLYEAGADYVVVPEVTGGEKIIRAVKGREKRERHIRELKEKMEKGLL